MKYQKGAAITLAILMTFGRLKAQEYELKQIISENIVVSSTAASYNPFASNKRDRVVRPVELPAGTVAYTFRVRTAQEPPSSGTSLLSELNKLPSAELATLRFISSLCSASDGSQSDVYFFDSWSQANSFEAKAPGWWACKAFKQTTSTCRTSNECLKMVAVGFRNNNSLAAVNVFFELVAIIDVSRADFSNEVYGTIYQGCLALKEVERLPREQGESACECIAMKLASNVPFRTTMTELEKKQVLTEEAKKCLVDLKLISSTGFDRSVFIGEVKQIEQSGGLEEVIRYCEEKLAAGNENDIVYSYLGRACLFSRQFTKAAHYLGIAQEKYPFNLAIACSYAHALLLTGKRDAAIEVYKAHIEENIEGTRSWRDAVKADIERFKKMNVNSNYFGEVLAIMDNQ